MAAMGLFHARFMDDWVVLAPSRWKLRVAVRCVNQTLAELNVQQHPDKTIVGHISGGFGFLGYRFTAAGLLGVAMQTIQRCVERMNQLYEQGADCVRIGDYVRRWRQWVRSGLDGWRSSSPRFTLPPSPCVAQQSDGTDPEEDEGAWFGNCVNL